MEDKLVVFENSDFSVRTIKDNGAIWFVAKDVAKALEYSEASLDSPNKLFAHVPQIWTDRKRFLVRSENGVEQEREMLCISEQGLYFFLGRSDKPKALPYQMWIADEVVPSIRKTGSYSRESYLIEDSIERAKAWILEEEQRRALMAKAEEQKQLISSMKPKAEYFDDLVERNMLSGIRETAKAFKIKQNDFVKFLLENKFCYRDNKYKLQPYSPYVNTYFELKESKNDKNAWSGMQLFITPKGREAFRLLLQGAISARNTEAAR